MKYFVCDLDDCLIKTDLLVEQWLVLIKMKPWFILVTFIWLLKGKAHLKNQLAMATTLSVTSLPYRQELLNLIKSWKAENQGEVILASASPQIWVDEISKYLGCFDHAIGSTPVENRKGLKKLEAVKAVIGDRPFSYAGDSFADMPIWKSSAEIVVVNPSSALAVEIQHLSKPTHTFNDRKSPLPLLIKQLRPHQWVKNALVFLPIIASHQISDLGHWLNGVIGFIGFSAAASFVYVLNDLLDLSADRNHRTKKNRPFASGNLSLGWGILLLPLLLVASMSTVVFLPLPFLMVIGTYLSLNLLYSFYLKKKEILDIIIFSSMYTLRIFAGSAATGIVISDGF